jgi:hypothetical protein
MDDHPSGARQRPGGQNPAYRPAHSPWLWMVPPLSWSFSLPTLTESDQSRPLKAAVWDRLIAASACLRVALPKRAVTKVVPLSVSNVEVLADAVPDPYRALVVFALAGAPPGGVLQVTLDRVDFLRGPVRLGRQLIRAQGGVPEFGPPKGAAGFRNVPMPKVV